MTGNRINPPKYMWMAPDDIFPRRYPGERCGVCGGTGERTDRAAGVVRCACNQRVCPQCRGDGKQLANRHHGRFGVRSCISCHGYGFQVGVDIGVKH